MPSPLHENRKASLENNDDVDEIIDVMGVDNDVFKDEYLAKALNDI